MFGGFLKLNIENYLTKCKVVLYVRNVERRVIMVLSLKKIVLTKFRNMLFLLKMHPAAEYQMVHLY